MDRRKTIENLYSNLERLDHKEIVKLFTANALVHTPLRDQAKASLYFPEIISHTKSMKIEVKDIFQGIDHPDHMAAHCSFNWHLPGGTIKNKLAVSLLKFESHSDKIAELHILYDATDVQDLIKTALHHH